LACERPYKHSEPPRGALSIVQKSRFPSLNLDSSLGFRHLHCQLHRNNTCNSSIESVVVETNIKMRLALLAIVFATAVAAKPWPWAAPAASLVPSASGKAPHNKTHRGNRTTHHHHEQTPTFKMACDCQKPIVPMNLLSENEVSTRCLDVDGLQGWANYVEC
jgi:hypothetical protein